MAGDERLCYVYVQFPGTLETVPCASLKVRSIGAGAYEGTFTYGRRYLERPAVVALDPYHLPLSTRPMQYTKQKGIPGAVRDASPDAWGRRVIQAKLQRQEADIQEIAMTINLTPRKCLGYRSPVEAFLSELGRDARIRFA